MAIIKPFKAYRPDSKIAAKVASRPYDVLNSEEARAEIQDNPFSFLRIIKSEVDLPTELSTYDPQVYQKAKENFDAFVKKGTLVQDELASFYLYRLQMGDHVQTGIVAVSSIDDYFDDVIKKHEYTRPTKEQDRITHTETTGIHSGPVFTAYRQNNALDQIVQQYCQENRPEVDFDAGDGVQHTLWVVSEKDVVQSIENIFKNEVTATYIADGHHRAASSAKVGQKLRSQNPDFSNDESFNYFLSVLFPDDQLEIIDYNRVIKDLNGHTEERFLELLGEKFDLQKVTTAFKPQKPYSFGFYLNDQWYSAQLKDSFAPASHPIQSLDISILQELVLEPILGIKDQRTDARIDFVGGIRGLGELERRVNSGEMRLAIAIYPVSMQQLFEVADSGEVMPPKSTWFEPKLRSGLVVHRFLE